MEHIAFDYLTFDTIYDTIIMEVSNVDRNSKTVSVGA